MTLPYPVLLVAHRGLAEGLLAAAEAILGERLPVDHLSNEGKSPRELGKEIDAWLAAHPGPVLILADLGFGSCCQTARLVSRDRDEVAVLAGVNLPIVLAVVRSRAALDFPSYVRHLVDRGRESVEPYLAGNPL
jgi:mannose/fructose-specific phosphotransferase system component IIA